MKKISNNFSVSGPIDNNLIKALKEQGITRFVNVRPDNEESDQESSENIALRVKSYGVDYFHIPVKTNQYSEYDIAEFSKIIIYDDAKVHAFCRTGNRAIHLWALANSYFNTLQYIEEQCKKSDCNISSVVGRMQEIEQAKLCLHTNN
jgi:sulfide:quinone oxidoreductase